MNNNEEKKDLGVKLGCFEPVDGGIENPVVREKLDIKDDISNTVDKPTDSVGDKDIEEFLSQPTATREPPQVTLIKREEWSKIELPEQYLQYTKPLNFVLLSHTGTSTCKKKEECIQVLRTLQRTHIALGYADIIYNFLIGGDGNVYEGRGWVWESAWIPKYDESTEKCLKVAHIGYYGDNSKKKVEPKLDKVMFDLLEIGMFKNHVSWNATMIPDYNEPNKVEMF